MHIFRSVNLPPSHKQNQYLGGGAHQYYPDDIPIALIGRPALPPELQQNQQQMPMMDRHQMGSAGKTSVNGSAGRRRLPNLAAIYGARRGRTDSQRPLNDSNDSSLGGGAGGGSYGNGGGTSGPTMVSAFNNGFRGSGDGTAPPTYAAGQYAPPQPAGQAQRFIFVNRK